MQVERTNNAVAKSEHIICTTCIITCHHYTCSNILFVSHVSWKSWALHGVHVSHRCERAHMQSKESLSTTTVAITAAYPG